MMEENARELIEEAVEAAGVTGDIDQVIENELHNLANGQPVAVAWPTDQGLGAPSWTGVWVPDPRYFSWSSLEDLEN